jgi:hypothetical protein
MTQPKVTITELDGALGVLPPSAGALFALVGVSSSGPIDTPATYARITDIVAAFGAGPLVEAAAHYIEKYGRPVVLVRTGQTTAGAAGSVTKTGTGTTTAVVTTPTPNDDYEAYVVVIAGGEIGTAGITYQWSLDGGRTLSPVTALGTDLTITLPGAGGVVITLQDEETLVAGDTISFRTSAPRWNTTEIGTALDALRDSAVTWELAEIVGDMAGADFDAVDPKFTGMATGGRYRAWIGGFRMPAAAESEATYLAAFSTAFGAKATVHGEICAGACWMISSVSGRQYRRPVAFVVGAREASVSHEVNIADVNLGSLPGISIRDDNGNVVHHDESVNPGLDDARATVLRTWDGIQGVYVNRPRVLSAEGSDFQLLAHRRVLNLAHAALRLYFIRRLNKPVLVDKTTGFILESEALEIESGARAAMRSVLLAKPKASGIQFALSRVDNLLSTKTLNGTARVIPLAYPEFIDLEVGFLNPALQVVTA